VIEAKAAVANAYIKGIDPQAFLERWPDPESWHMRLHSKDFAEGTIKKYVDHHDRRDSGQRQLKL